MPTAPTDRATTTIYVRVPRATKEAAEAHAKDHAMTLTASISDLLDRGLEAVENEGSIADMQEQVRQRDVLLAQQATRLRGLEALANQPLASCGQCKAVVTTADLLVHRKCPNGHGIKAPDSGKGTAGVGLDENQSLVLIGAVGLLLGALFLANANA